MTLEEIVTDRHKLAIGVFDGSKAEMANLGLTIDSLQLVSIDDMGAGHIAAMAARYQAARLAQADQQAVAEQQQDPEGPP